MANGQLQKIQQDRTNAKKALTTIFGFESEKNHNSPCTKKEARAYFILHPSKINTKVYSR